MVAYTSVYTEGAHRQLALRALGFSAAGGQTIRASCSSQLNFPIVILSLVRTSLYVYRFHNSVIPSQCHLTEATTVERVFSELNLVKN